MHSTTNHDMAALKTNQVHNIQTEKASFFTPEVREKTRTDIQYAFNNNKNEV